ncbi:hypothetical protein [Nocardia mikamii]|uniref:hypothetical protein n=1 Tax=Nocardia mikamii TaxID=508464 RepID=UPI0007A41F62|nr:hypothetical protein [Nocardia mikamii]
MRTAVIRVDVDPAGELSPAEFDERISALTSFAAESGMAVTAPEIDRLPARRREIQLLIDGADTAAMREHAVGICAEIFGSAVRPGPVTFVSRGTDDDAHGVLAGFGITGEIDRTHDEDGFDTLTVRLASTDLERIPESRIQTALEAATNAEVIIVAR